MDDYLDSFDDPDVAFKKSQELITLLALGGFKLTKFIRNVTKINKELNPPQSAPQQESKNIVTCGDNFSHVLGLKWDHIDDTLVVSRGVNRELKKFDNTANGVKFCFFRFRPNWSRSALYRKSAIIVERNLAHSWPTTG